MSEASRSEPGNPGPAPSERRAAVRHACRLDTSCRSVAGIHDVRWPARLRDVSTTGLCLLVSRRFEPGTLLEIDVQNAAGDAPSTLVARVVRVNRQAGGDWAVGCAFATPLSEAELAALVS
jgi:hypothetical protein